MPETTHAGPTGYREVSGTASTPHPDSQPSAPPAAEPFTPPDTSQMGYGKSAGGTTGPGGNGGGGIANAISGAGKGMLDDVIGMLPDLAAAV
jgi:hypothetical protein